MRRVLYVVGKTEPIRPHEPARPDGVLSKNAAFRALHGGRFRTVIEVLHERRGLGGNR
jgi:hypothetical protein